MDDDEDRQPTKTVLRKEYRREDHYLCIEIQPYFAVQPLHDIAMHNIVWCMTYNRGVGGGLEYCAMALQ